MKTGSQSLLETVPNFSEGRNEEVIEALTTPFKETDHVYFLDLHTDPDHNRSVITAAGREAPLRTALFEAVRTSIVHISVTGHEGTHPYMGATDVIPFVPLENAGMEDAIQASRVLGHQLGSELNLPVFLYAESATREQTRKLHRLRRYGLQSLNRKIQTDPSWCPDFGPSFVHPTGGATAVGARDFLIALNVDLRSGDWKDADAIARAVRASSGGLPGVQAIGMELENQDRLIVSMNLADFRKTSLYALIGEVGREAEKRGLEAGDTELVGLVPREAVRAGDPADLRIPNFDPDRHVLENRLDRVRESVGT